MPESQENQVPTKEQLISALQEQIDVKKLQTELQELNTRLAQGRANELEAYAKIAHFSNNTPKDGVVEHTVTQEDIDLNPEMTQQGIKVGDRIGIPKEVYEQFISKKKISDAPEADGEKPERKLRAVSPD